jgi:hypothetical protein
MKQISQLGFILLVMPCCALAGEPTKASESVYNRNILLATTSDGLTKADLAWHAERTYGWDCAEVFSKGTVTKDGYFVIKCSSGKSFRVYPRDGKHTTITNMKGGFE